MERTPFVNKTVTLGEVFAPEQLELAKNLIARHKDVVLKPLVAQLVNQVTEPSIEHINQTTGQENDPTYWAWMLVYAFQKGSK